MRQHAVSGSYILGVVPLAGVALLEFGLDRMAKLGVRAALVGVFLAIGHVAMIFGMLDPSLGAAGVPRAGPGRRGPGFAPDLGGHQA